MKHNLILKKEFDDMVETVDCCISDRVNIGLIKDTIQYFEDKPMHKNLFKTILILKTNTKLEEKGIFKEDGTKLYCRLCDAIEFYYSVNQKNSREKIQLLNNIKEIFYS